MPTLTAALRRNADIYRDSIAILDREVSYTWSQFIERVARAAGLLRDMDMHMSDRYAILATNSWRQAELIYAGYWIGAIPVPINFRLAPPEIHDILEDADCRSMAIDPQFSQLLEAQELETWSDRSFYLCPADDNNGRNYEALIANATPADPVNTLLMMRRFFFIQVALPEIQRCPSDPSQYSQ